MPISPVSQTVINLERLLKQAADGLLSTDPSQAEAANQMLRSFVEGLIAFTQNAGSASAQDMLRLVELKDAMGMLRQSLARRSAFVDQALHIVVPNRAQHTYGDSKQRYALGAKRSGTISGLSA